MKRQYKKPFQAPRKTGDQQRQEQTIRDSEDPTELGLVWPQPAVQHVSVQESNPWWPEDTLGGVDAVEEPRNEKEVMEESPRLSDYESEGFIARRIERTTPQKFSDGFKLLNSARKAPSKKSAKPSWVYEPILSTVSQSAYWDTLGVDSVSASHKRIEYPLRKKQGII